MSKVYAILSSGDEAYGQYSFYDALNAAYTNTNAAKNHIKAVYDKWKAAMAQTRQIFNVNIDSTGMYATREDCCGTTKIEIQEIEIKDIFDGLNNNI